MRKTIIAGNWKMNMCRKDTEQFFAQLKESCHQLIAEPHNAFEVILAVPYVLIETSQTLVRGTSICIAAQNVHQKTHGAYTGEVSVPMLKDAGVSLSLIAHSERRQYYNESDASALEKVQACLQGGVRPLLCVGESTTQREQGQTFAVIARQLEGLLGATEDCGDLILAYEPVWAIGTGVAATADQAQEVHRFIRDLLAKRYGPASAERIPILYGGSVTPSNFAEFLEKPDIDGGLIGGASLKAASFAGMIRCAADHPSRGG